MAACRALTIWLLYLLVLASYTDGEFTQILNCENQHWEAMCLNYWGYKVGVVNAYERMFP